MIKWSWVFPTGSRCAFHCLYSDRKMYVKRFPGTPFCSAPTAVCGSRLCAHSCAQPSTELTCDPLPDAGLLLGNPHPPSLMAPQLGSNLEPAVFEAMHRVLCGVCCSWLWTITQAVGQSSHWEWDSCVLKSRRESVWSVYLCIYSLEPLYHSAHPFRERRGAIGWDRRPGQEKHKPACPACKVGRWLHPERSATLSLVGASDRSRLW